MIPDQLKRDDLLFVVFEPKGDNKNPNFPRWNAVENLLKHDDPELQTGIDRDMVIGCAGAPGGGIVIFDVDKREEADPAGIMDICGDTFRVSGYSDERKFKAFFDVVDIPDEYRDGRGKRTLHGVDVFVPGGWGTIKGDVDPCWKVGGQCVIPPSKHHSGSRYEVTNDVPIKRARWQDIKHFYPDDVAKGEGGRKPARTPYINGAEPIPEGYRYSTLFSIACQQRERFGFNSDEIHTVISAVNKNRCNPPLFDDELRRIAGSAAGYPTNSKPDDEVRAAELAAGLLAPYENRAEDETEIANADDLVSGYQAQKIKMDFSILPGDSLISKYIQHMQKRSDSYPEYAFTGALFAISTLTRRNAFIKFNHSVKPFFPGVWIMNLGASTISRKSTALDAIGDVLEATLNDGLIDTRAPRRCENSFSPEGFVESMAEHPIQYHLLDECGQLLADMQKSYMSNMRDVFLSIHGGGDYTRRRSSKKGGEPNRTDIIKPFFTALLTTTPGTLAKHTVLLDLQSGWLLRYLYAMPSYPKDFKAFEPDDAAINAEYDTLIKWFKRINAIFAEHVIQFELSADAMFIYQSWQRDQESKLTAENDELKLSAYGRLCDYVPVIAIIHSITDPAFLDADFSKRYIVGRRELEMAITHIEDYFMPVFLEVCDIV
ncbi:DUF3987 domain-containing protein, partial [Methanocalculus sp.]|uniref:DUF3987 domain-containing protein n=1 Tax=Methanocalculus sp. TaxID=2004547 RepID=UPI0026120ECD